VLDLVTPTLALLSRSPGPYVALLLAGFAIGIVGHVFKVRTLILAGIALIVIGALLLPLAAGIPSSEKSPPAEESLGAPGE
jgi:hypothetical protein